jgi:predicted ArsR family transcriptional regulator
MQPQQPQPDPKLMAEQVKAKTEIQKAQMDLQGTAMGHQLDMQKMAAEAQLNQLKTRNQLAVQAAKPPTQPPMPGMP